MSKRKQHLTSILAYEKIMKGRDSHHKKILLALEWLVEGNSWEIAAQSRLKPEQVWRRMGELCEPDENGQPLIIDTGKRNLNPDGNLCIVYGLYQNRANYAAIKPPAPEIKPADLASVLVAKTKRGKLIQKGLFDEV